MTATPNKPHKGVYILPNLFTTASLFAAFMAILWASQGNIKLSALAILFSALMDGLDGKVARLTNTASEFGVQYDSLADLVAFGLAPAFMVYQWQLAPYGRLAIAVSFLLVACAALRLARFNVSTAVTPKKFFIGLPTPATGCTLACLVFFSDYLPIWLRGALPPFVLLLTFVLACLMVSQVRYASFKEYGFVKAYPFRSMVVVILLFVLVVAAPKILGFCIFLGYLISGLVYTYYMLPRHMRMTLLRADDTSDSSDADAD